MIGLSLAMGISLTSKTVLDNDGLGIELVVNGDFAADTDWTKAAEVTISGGAANFTLATVNALFQDIGLAAGKTYRVNADVVSTSQGLEVHPGGDVASTDFRTTGNQTWLISPITPNGNVIFNGQPPGFSGTLDNVSVKEIL